MSENIICEIINPSDPYTLVTDDFTVAAVAVALLGGGQYGLEGGGGRSPVLFGWDDWFSEKGIADLSAYIDANRDRIADVLDSVLIGDRDDRVNAESLLALTPEADREPVRAKWTASRHDRMRSSMNDIGGRAAKLAEKLRNPRPIATPEPRP